jgi:hypothetical protein
MANADLEPLRRRARRAYEIGRLVRACIDAWPVLVIVALALTFTSRPGVVAAIGGSLALGVVALGWVGRGLQRAIVPGLLAGSLPLVAGLGACHIPHGCGGPTCMRWCMPFIATAAVAGGVYMAMRLRRLGGRRRIEVLATTIVATWTGAMGCLAFGYGGLLGVAAGILVGAAPVIVHARAR